MLLDFSPGVIAHRGWCAAAPENTMAAFIKAAQLGIKWIEFDVMQAACGTAVIFHDVLLDRTTNGTGALIDYHYTYLRTLDAGAWFDPKYASEKIPTLAEVMTFLIDSNLSANVELKPQPGNEEAFVISVLEEVTQYFPQPTTRILFSSFSLHVLAYLRKHAPQCVLGLLWDEEMLDWQHICQELNCNTVNINQMLLTPTLAQQIKAMHKYLLCYTVNQPERAKQLFSWGVDAVFTDVPNLIINQT